MYNMNFAVLSKGWLDQDVSGISGDLSAEPESIVDGDPFRYAELIQNNICTRVYSSTYLVIPS